MVVDGGEAGVDVHVFAEGGDPGGVVGCGEAECVVECSAGDGGVNGVPVGGGDGELAVGVEFEDESGEVDESVVGAAQADEVGDVGGAAVGVGDEVVGVEAAGVVAAGELAGGVVVCEPASLLPVGSAVPVDLADLDPIHVSGRTGSDLGGRTAAILVVGVAGVVVVGVVGGDEVGVAGEGVGDGGVQWGAVGGDSGRRLAGGAVVEVDLDVGADLDPTEQQVDRGVGAASAGGDVALGWSGGGGGGWCGRVARIRHVALLLPRRVQCLVLECRHLNPSHEEQRTF